MNRIERTQLFLKETYDRSDYLQQHPKEYAYRYEHTLRVAQWGKKIAEAEGLDVEAVVVGCLLHDVSYSEPMHTEAEIKGHGRRSEVLSRAFIKSLGFDEPTQHAILYGIATHVDGEAGFEGTASVLSETISDADNLDRFDVYRIYESLEYTKFSEMSLEAKIEHCNERIERADKLLNLAFATPYATAVFHEEVRVSQAFFMKMKQQLEMSITF